MDSYGIGPAGLSIKGLEGSDIRILGENLESRVANRSGPAGTKCSVRNNFQNLGSKIEIDFESEPTEGFWFWLIMGSDYWFRFWVLVLNMIIV